MKRLPAIRPTPRPSWPRGSCAVRRATAVDGVDLEIDRGEIYGFLGPNGAGKSTTVRMLCTLLGAHGRRGHRRRLRRGARSPASVRLRIGVALQEVALDPKQTGAELLRLQGRAVRTAEAGPIAGRVAQLGELIDLGDALDRRIATYSGGMRRRLDLAAALVHNPEILFLDEPTTGLDPVSRVRVWDEVRRLNERARHDDLPHHAVPRGGRRARATASASSTAAASSPRARPPS